MAKGSRGAGPASSHNDLQQLIGRTDPLLQRVLVPRPPFLMTSLPSEEQVLPLHQAALGGRKQDVAELLAAGADAHTADSSGRTAMHLAAMAGKAACIALLAAAGADIEARCSAGTPLHVAAEHGQVRLKQMPRHA
jgi:ankyrin repeat protein